MRLDSSVKNKYPELKKARSSWGFVRIAGEPTGVSKLSIVKQNLKF